MPFFCDPKKSIISSIYSKTDQYNELSKEVAAQGMEVTKNVVEEQDRQRQKLLQLVRGTVSKKVEVKKLWRKIINRLTQERYCFPRRKINMRKQSQNFNHKYGNIIFYSFTFSHILVSFIT